MTTTPDEPAVRIATEEAFVTPQIMSAWRRVLESGVVEPGFAKMGQTILGQGLGAARVHARLLDLGEGRIAQMDSDGVSMQVVSLTSPGVQVFPPDLAANLAAEANDVLAEAVARRPDRLAGLAAIAPHAVAESTRELERARNQLGLRGVIINSHTQGRWLDETAFWPLFEAAEALGLPVYLHPREPAPSMVAPFLDYGLYFAGWGFAAECGLHAMRLIMSGVFDRFPNLIMILGHLGEGIPFWLDRIDNRYRLQVKIGAARPLARLPSEYFRSHFYVTTSGMPFAAPFRLVLDTVALDRIMFAADYPYEDARSAVDFLDVADITPAERETIYRSNAARLFSLAV